MRWLFAMHCLYLAACLCCIQLTQAVSLESEFDHSAWLDTNETYKLHWTVNRIEKSISFAAQVKTTGWIGFGIAKGLVGSMKGSDIAMGWVDKSGKGHITDRHGIGNLKPKKDAKQDYQLLGSSQNNTWTVLKFKRNLITCDKDDNDIDTVTTKIIFAWGTTKPDGADDSSLNYHGNSRRGSRSLNLLNYVKNSPIPAGAKSIDFLQRNISVPATETTYWCTPFRISDLVKLNSTKHVVEIAPVIQKRAEGLVHHMLLYGCRNDFDPTHLNVTGRCYQSSMPKSIRECAGSSVIYGWAIGGVNFKFPDDVGYPLGGVNDYKYVLLETHFDNPMKRTDFVDTSGLRLYYTNPRKYEAATLTTGHLVNANMLIPPNMPDWVITGICTKECSERVRGSMANNGDTINFFASFPHAHTAGKSIHTVLVRNGTAQHEVIRDDNYDFDFQQTYIMEKFLKFKAGDELFTYCKYNTVGRKYASIGGLGTKDEMCLNFIMYYPRVNLTVCESQEQLLYNDFSKKYANPSWISGIGLNKSAPNTWPKTNWTGVQWNAAMMKNMRGVLNYNGTYAIGGRCAGIGGHYYRMPVLKQRPMILHGLPPKPNVCTKGPTSKSQINTSIVSIMFTLLAASLAINSLVV